MVKIILLAITLLLFRNANSQDFVGLCEDKVRVLMEQKKVKIKFQKDLSDFDSSEKYNLMLCSMPDITRLKTGLYFTSLSFREKICFDYKALYYSKKFKKNPILFYDNPLNGFSRQTVKQGEISWYNKKGKVFVELLDVYNNGILTERFILHAYAKKLSGE